jgi:DNA-binding SARP family transcriptional activator
MAASIPLPQLARIRRRLERETAPTVVITGWVGSGVDLVGEGLLVSAQGACQPLPDELANGGSGIPSLLEAGARSGVHWWILLRRPTATLLRAFRRHRTASQRLVWTARAGDLVGAAPDRSWSPRSLLLRPEEILTLAQQTASGAITIAEAYTLQRITAGWLEPVRRILAAELPRGRVPRTVSEALELEAVREFFMDEFLAAWPVEEIDTLARLAAMATVPIAAVRGGRGEPEGRDSTDPLWLAQEVLVPAEGGGWQVPRLLAAALATMERDEENVVPMRAAEPGMTMSELQRLDPETASAVSHLAPDEADLRTWIDQAWLEIVSTVSLDAARGLLRHGGLVKDAEPSGGVGLLAGLVEALDRPVNGAPSPRGLAQLAWRDDQPTLAVTAELSSRLLRFVGEGRRPVAELDAAPVGAAWPLALRGLERLHGLVAGLGRGTPRGATLEEAWKCLDLRALAQGRAVPTVVQELGLRVIGALVADDEALRRRFEMLMAAGTEPLRRRFDPWLKRTGAVAVSYRICLLGPPGAERRFQDEPAEPLPGSLRREILLLARLATAGKSGVTREEIRQVVWPDRSTEFVERNFHPTVSRLRRTLWLQRGEMPDPIVARQGVYRLAPGYAWNVDAVEFIDAVSEADEAHRQSRGGAEARALERACELYDGPFLPGFGEPWPTRMRQRLATHQNEVCHRLAGYLERQGEWSRAVDLLRLALTESPADERAHRHLMELFRSTGRRDLVLREYERLVAALEPLGTAPDDETATLFRELMR